MRKLLGCLFVSIFVLYLPANAGDSKALTAPIQDAPSLAETSPVPPPVFLIAQNEDPDGAQREPTAGESPAEEAASAEDEGAGDEGQDRADGVEEDLESGDAEDGEFTVLIKSIEIKGNTVIDTQTLQEKVDTFKNKDLTLEEMGEVADLVTITYQEEGYILARAYLPEQEVQKGVLTIAVQEGKIGKIIVSGGRHFDERVIKRYFKPQEKHGAIKESLLEKGLLLSSTTPNLKTDIVLKEGEQVGEVDLVVNTQDTSEVTFGLDASIDYNNFGAALVSEDRYGISMNIIDHNWGSELKLRGVTGNTYEDSTLAALRLKIPVYHYGTKLTYSYLAGNYVVGQAFADLGLSGRTKNWGVGVVHPIITKKNMNLDIEFSYESKYSEQDQLEELAHIDDVDAFAVGLNFDNLDRFLGKNIVSLLYFMGSNDFDKEFSPSRANIDEDFWRINLIAARIQKVYGNTNALLRATGQYSPDRLPSTEQTILGGFGSVRGHAPSQFLGDYGYGVSAELMFAPPFIADKTIFGQRLAQMVQFALFYDHGGVYNHDSEPGEIDSETLSGYGAGVRLFYKDIFSFKYDLGIPVEKVDEGDDYINYFTGSLKFF